jgi:hypothetical protein
VRTDFGLFENWVLWATFGDKRREEQKIGENYVMKDLCFSNSNMSGWGPLASIFK